MLFNLFARQFLKSQALINNVVAHSGQDEIHLMLPRIVQNSIKSVVRKDDPREARIEEEFRGGALALKMRYGERNLCQYGSPEQA